MSVSQLEPSPVRCSTKQPLRDFSDDLDESSGFEVWLKEPFQNSERELVVARYIESGPLALAKLTLEHDIVTYATKDSCAHEFDPLSRPYLLHRAPVLGRNR